MPDAVLGSEARSGVVLAPKAEGYVLKPMVGYCADCGTWDAHTQFCAACGYDFAPVPVSESADLTAL